MKSLLNNTIKMVKELKWEIFMILAFFLVCILCQNLLSTPSPVDTFMSH